MRMRLTEHQFCISVQISVVDKFGWNETKAINVSKNIAESSQIKKWVLDFLQKFKLLLFLDNPCH